VLGTMNVLAARLRNQNLIESKRRKAAQVVAALGAMQAQDYPAAKWGIGLRSPGLQDPDVEEAFNDGLILRTHVLRPTWHFVAPEDIRWLLALSAPRIHAGSAHYYRQSGLDTKTLNKSCALMHRVLEGGKAMTRAELAEYLRRAKVSGDGLKLSYLVMFAELEGVVCSGPRRGKQFTYQLLDERVAATKPRPRDQALADLAKRYFSSHGPATIRDFSWWSGLTIRDARQAAESAAKGLEKSSIDGLSYWSARGTSDAATKSGLAFLLPNYDEYLVAYKDRTLVVDSERSANMAARSNSALANHVVIDGRLAGNWSRTIRSNGVLIEVAPYRKLTPAHARAVAAAADCYGEFLGLPATLSIV
jgi:hypothetical protein